MEELQVKSLFNKLVKRNGGFTLTELAVAMVVVGILASIAVPSFLGARNNAFDREAQAAVDAALNAASLHYANNGDFTNSTSAACDGNAQLAADLQRLEPNHDFVAGASTSGMPRQVSVQAALTYNNQLENLGCQAFYATALSRSGACWVGRVTVEGAFLSSLDEVASKANSAIAVNTGTANTSNSATTGFADLKVNGRAYGGIVATSPAADSTGSLILGPAADSVQINCTAANQATLLGATAALGDRGKADKGVNPASFYDSWRTVKVLTAISNAN
jgi:prepilin-type N-terminal cleavage/methylation domain-containing protein